MEMHWVVTRTPPVDPHTQLKTYSTLFQNQQMQLAIKVTTQDLHYFEDTNHTSHPLLELMLFSIIHLMGNGPDTQFQWYPGHFWEPHVAPLVTRTRQSW